MKVICDGKDDISGVAYICTATFEVKTENE